MTQPRSARYYVKENLHAPPGTKRWEVRDSQTGGEVDEPQYTRESADALAEHYNSIAAGQGVTDPLADTLAATVAFSEIDWFERYNALFKSLRAYGRDECRWLVSTATGYAMGAEDYGQTVATHQESLRFGYYYGEHVAYARITGTGRKSIADAYKAWLRGEEITPTGKGE